MNDSELIDALGGPAKLAERLGYVPSAGGVQRVHNWRRRGIPAAVKVQHPDLFLRQPAQDDSPPAKASHAD